MRCRGFLSLFGMGCVSRSVRAGLLALLLAGSVCLDASSALAKGGGGRAAAAPARQYDNQGRHTGRIDADGRRYDSQGRYQGRTDPVSGRLYDSQGRYIGKTDETGRMYNAQGVHTGRIDPTGRIYNAQGVYQGRVDADGRQYDSQGRFTGRLNADTPSPALKTEAARDARAHTQGVRTEDSQRIMPSSFCAYGDPGCGQP